MHTIRLDQKVSVPTDTGFFLPAFSLSRIPHSR